MDEIELIDLTEEDEVILVVTSHNRPSYEASIQTVTVREPEEHVEVANQNEILLISSPLEEPSDSQNETRQVNPSTPVLPPPTSNRRRKKRKVPRHAGELRSTKRIRMSDAAPTDIGCPICLMTIEELKIEKARMSETMCGHSFCYNCLRQWMIARGRKCPVCRRLLRIMQKKQ